MTPKISTKGSKNKSGRSPNNPDGFSHDQPTIQPPKKCSVAHSMLTSRRATPRHAKPKSLNYAIISPERNNFSEALKNCGVSPQFIVRKPEHRAIIRPMYAIIRTQKLKSKRAISGAIRHNLREQNTPNADPEALRENEVLEGPDTHRGVMHYYDEKLPNKVRSNAVHGIETVVTASPEWFENKTPQEREKFFKDSLNFVSEKMGGRRNVISAVVHNDEKTPHMQVVAMPLVDGKLNARKLIGGGKSELAKLQSDFAKQVGAKHGLERGKEKSKAHHQSIKDFYSKQVNSNEPIKAPATPEPPSRIASEARRRDYMQSVVSSVHEPLKRRIEALERRQVGSEMELKRERSQNAEIRERGGLTAFKSLERDNQQLKETITSQSKTIDRLSHTVGAQSESLREQTYQRFKTEHEQEQSQHVRTREQVERGHAHRDDRASYATDKSLSASSSARPAGRRDHHR